LDGCGKSPPPPPPHTHTHTHTHTGFDLRTVHVVASCYTDLAIPAHRYITHMQILCETSVTENTARILDGQTKLAALAPPFLPRTPFSSITTVIKLASKPVLSLSDGEIFPLESCSVLSITSTNTFGVRPSPTQALRLIRWLFFNYKVYADISTVKPTRCTIFRV